MSGDKKTRNLKRVPPSLETLTWGLNALMHCGDALSKARSSTELMQAICEAITKQENYPLAWIGFANKDLEKTIEVMGLSGTASAYARGIIVSWSENKLNGQGPIGRCIRTKLACFISDTETDPNFEPWRQRASDYGIRSVLAVPIVKGNEVIGALSIYASTAKAFTDLEVHIFSNLAAELGFGLNVFEKQEALNAEYLKQKIQDDKLRKSLTSIVEVMSKTMELRDPYTSGHQKNVATIACAIAKRLAWEEDKIYGLRLAAMVHDIGKIGVPSEILTKPSGLTEFEGKLLQEHPENGYHLLKDIEFPWPIAEIVRQHHERLDGSGYPKGLTGDQILLEAQVIAVADTIEAMYSHRPYRAGLGLPAALKVIKEGSGTKYDAAIAKVALELFRGKEVIALDN